MSKTSTKKAAFEAMWATALGPAKTVSEFECWLLERAHRPEDSPDSDDYRKAWVLLRDFLHEG